MEGAGITLFEVRDLTWIELRVFDLTIAWLTGICWYFMA